MGQFSFGIIEWAHCWTDLRSMMVRDNILPGVCQHIICLNSKIFWDDDIIQVLSEEFIFIPLSHFLFLEVMITKSKFGTTSKSAACLPS
jgi:hypothetical protein